MSIQWAGYILLTAAAVCNFFWLKALLSRRLCLLQNSYHAVSKKCALLAEENSGILEENRRLEEKAGRTISLFDLTKEISRFLDKDDFFLHFKEHLLDNSKISECRLVEQGIEQFPEDKFTVLPVEIEKKNYGYLVLGRTGEEDREKTYILSQQFILGLRRTLLYKKVQDLAITDGLTGIYGRRYFLERAEEELERSRKFNFKFSFLMVDIDNFKKHNDHYGHLVGDVILKEVARVIKENIRQIDLCGKYGGDEFALILSETSEPAAELAAERIRRAIESNPIRAYDEELSVTVSIGISSFSSRALKLPQLIEKADKAMYRAKSGGKNKVCL